MPFSITDAAATSRLWFLFLLFCRSQITSPSFRTLSLFYTHVLYLFLAPVSNSSQFRAQWWQDVLSSQPEGKGIIKPHLTPPVPAFSDNLPLSLLYLLTPYLSWMLFVFVIIPQNFNSYFSPCQSCCFCFIILTTSAQPASSYIMFSP